MPATMTADQKLVKQSWQKAYKAALDADIWGQADDAQDNYHKSAAHTIRTTIAVQKLQHSTNLLTVP